MRSACRGVAENRSMPKRAMSKRGLPTAIISIAQQARPNCAGHTEFFRAMLSSFATVVSRIPSGSFSSSPMRSVPLESAATPDIGVDDEHREDEQDHLDQTEHAELVERDRPRVEEDDLDVEDDEQHRRQVVLHRELVTAERLRRRLDAALIGLELRPVEPLRPGQRSGDHGEDGETGAENKKDEDGDHVVFLLCVTWAPTGAGRRSV